MDASRPAALLFEHGYTHLARVADLIAREFPRDAEPIGKATVRPTKVRILQPSVSAAVLPGAC